MEKQFNESLHNKINRTHHLGLGFASNEGVAKKPPAEAPVIGKHTTFDSGDDEGKADSNNKATTK